MTKTLILTIVLACLAFGCDRQSGRDTQPAHAESTIIGTVSVPQPGGPDDGGWVVAEATTHSVKFPAPFAEYTTPLSSGGVLHGLTCRLNTGYELNVVRLRDPKGRSQSDIFAQHVADAQKDRHQVTGPFLFKGHRALHIKNNLPSRFGEMRVVYVNGVVFLLVAEGPKGKDLPFENSIAKFFDSLDIKEIESQQDKWSFPKKVDNKLSHR